MSQKIDDDVIMSHVVDPDLKMEPVLDKTLINAIKIQGGVALVMSLVIFTLLTVVKYVFKILESRFYAFCMAGTFAIFFFGVCMIMFERMLWCQKSKHFYKIYYTTIYFYMVLFISIGIAAFGCIRCVYALVLTSLSIPLIVFTIMILKNFRKNYLRNKYNKKAYSKVDAAHRDIFTVIKSQKTQISNLGDESQFTIDEIEMN